MGPKKVELLHHAIYYGDASKVDALINASPFRNNLRAVIPADLINLVLSYLEMDQQQIRLYLNEKHSYSRVQMKAVPIPELVPKELASPISPALYVFSHVSWRKPQEKQATALEKHFLREVQCFLLIKI